MTAAGADGVLGLDFLSQFTDIHCHVPSRILTLDPTDIELAIARARTDQASAEAQLRLVRVAARPEDVRERVRGRGAVDPPLEQVEREVDRREEEDP